MENSRFLLGATMEKFKGVSLKFMWSCNASNARLLNKLKFLQVEKRQYQMCSNMLHSDFNKQIRCVHFFKCT